MKTYVLINLDYRSTKIDQLIKEICKERKFISLTSNTKDIYIFKLENDNMAYNLCCEICKLNIIHFIFKVHDNNIDGFVTSDIGKKIRDFINNRNEYSLEKINDLNKLLEKAIINEDYEKAAELRDLIINKTNTNEKTI